ncbi:cerebellar degeneration-related protein 2 isoform X2 [Syngnathus scovelli]|uniref:cerebellar degeneration-related protein 2 isoform X2 n=1 Tax=Syngnathus scovelli TaxID=161590 RepID=UPI00210F4C56|nr:cerebellar degeneration-related protein 2 isoform X2 [Syngnathus scovelli]
MLTEGILEDDFDKNGDTWCVQRDLEHDLHLAAKLGKTLLERNRELEQAFQHMYSANEEQLLEIEYLAKQVELLRHVNEQHAKVYEQLDLSTRELERSNGRLVQDERLAQNKINSLAESIEGLQRHVEALRNRLEMVMTARSKQNKQERLRNLSAQSVPCLGELLDLEPNRQQTDGRRLPQESVVNPHRCRDPEEEHWILLGSVRTLQGQLATERTRREAAERESKLATNDKRGLERRLSLLAGSQARQVELEAQVEHLRLMWRDVCTSRKPDRLLLPDAMFYDSFDKSEADQDGSEEAADEMTEGQDEERQGQRRRSAASVWDDHDKMCVRRAEVVKQRGVLLLNEVDAHYNALQVKYNELLQRRQQPNVGLTHKSIQTSRNPSVSIHPQRRLSGSPTEASTTLEEPNYKVLFKEIFTCIQKTKEDVHKPRPVSDAPAM